MSARLANRELLTAKKLLPKRPRKNPTPYALSAALALAFTLTAARAQVVGTGVICDTQEELEAVVAKVNVTRNLETALAEVNAAYPSKENACGVGRVAYYPGKTAKTVWTVDGLRDIVEITVVGGVTPDGLRAVRPIEQYTLFKSEGQKL